VPESPGSYKWPDAERDKTAVPSTTHSASSSRCWPTSAVATVATLGAVLLVAALTALLLNRPSPAEPRHAPDADGDRRGWFVFAVQLPVDVEPDAVLRRLAERGVQSKPYLPAIYLMSYYRERLGCRPGQFPVCESVAERSIALPFFPEMTASQVERGLAGAGQSGGSLDLGAYFVGDP
jgi:DegT/DnrJ/EryC1/StrS aminotransferase family